MKILIAEDDQTSRMVLEHMLVDWKYDVIVANNGIKAWEILKKENSPELAILDWKMPGLEGVEVCQKVREAESEYPKYIIILTARNSKTDIVQGLEMGANDYIGKPFNKFELRARLRVGERILELQRMLFNKINELENALDHIKTLQGILPICMYCHKIRTDEKAWEKVDSYVEKHTEVRFSHSLCPECLEKHYPDEPENDENKKNKVVL